MIILALDTAMAACSVAIVDTARADPLAEEWQPMERGHAEAIAPMVERVAKASGLSLADVDRIAVTTGPGTFTGVRIGLAMARGLGLALNRPVIGIDSLQAIAANVPERVSVLAVADARNDEVYAALYGADGGTLQPPAVMTAAAAAAVVQDGTCVIGTAADAVIGLSRRTGVTRGTSGDLPAAAKFARLTAPMPDRASMPAPLYLRPPDARPQVQAAPFAASIETVSDAALLSALHGECFDTAWTAKDFAELLAMPGTEAKAAVEAGEPLAFALFRRAAGEVEVITIGTRPTARRRGLASFLLDRQLTDYLQQGARTAFIEVAVSNVPARAAYAAAGFTAAGLRRNYYERGGGLREDAVIMRKDLAP